MTVGTLKSQGTELYFIDDTTDSDPIIIKMACPTGITGLGGPADQLDDTCLDSTDRTFKRGLGNPGKVNVPFNFIPTNISHQVLFDLKESGELLNWLIGFSDGVGTPTWDSDIQFVIPTDRTTAEFVGYIEDVNIDIATNAIVKGTLIIQRSGGVTITAPTT